jgi:hypothetical protein
MSVTENVQLLKKLDMSSLRLSNQCVKTNDNIVIALDSPYIQLPLLSIVNLKDSELVLSSDDATKNVFQTLDKVFITHVKKLEVIKKYNIKGASYKSLLSSFNDEQVIKFAVNDNVIFFDEERNKFDISSGKKYLSAKVIIEMTNILINVVQKEISVELILKQVQLSNPVIVRRELTDYSFVETDSEMESEVDESDDDNTEDDTCSVDSD